MKFMHSRTQEDGITLASYLALCSFLAEVVPVLKRVAGSVQYLVILLFVLFSFSKID